MSKYIIDLRPDCKVVQQICAIDKGINIGSRSIGLLDELTDDYVKKNFKDLLEGEYQRGFEDGKKEAESSETIEQAKADAFNKGMLFKEEKIHDAYQRGLSEGNDIGYKDGVKDGQNEAWECAKKLFSTMSETEIEKVFPTEWENGFYGLMQMKPQYAIAKLKAYEEKQKADEDVKRGDVVRHKVNGLTYIVTLAGDCGYVLLGGDGNFATSCITNSFEKTGKHVDIDKILEGLRYDS